jgi:hypothetical protein
VEETGEFSAAEFISLEARRAYQLFTLPVLVLAALAMVDVRCRPQAEPGGDHWDALFVYGLLAVAAIHVLLFRHGAWVHDFWLLYFGAPLALLAARGALSLTASGTRVRVLTVLGLIFLTMAGLQVRALHLIQKPIVESSEIVQKTSEPDELIVSNILLMTTRNVSWHAARFIHDEPVQTLRHLQRTIDSMPMTTFVYNRMDSQPISNELEQWLRSNCSVAAVPSEDAKIGEVFRGASESARNAAVVAGEVQPPPQSGVF